MNPRTLKQIHSRRYSVVTSATPEVKISSNAPLHWSSTVPIRIHRWHGRHSHRLDQLVVWTIVSPGGWPGPRGLGQRLGCFRVEREEGEEKGGGERREEGGG